MSFADVLTLRNPRTLLILCLGISIAFWAKFITPDALIYPLDYTYRLLCIALICVYGGFRLQRTENALTPRTLAMTTLVTAVSLAVFHLYYQMYQPIPIVGDSIYGFPKINDDRLRLVDLTLGLALVALCEEMIFRYLSVKVFPTSSVTQYVISSLAFGLFHAPQGLLLVLVSMGLGLLYMWLYKITRTLAAPVLSHYLVDLIIFSDVLFIKDITFQF